MRVRVVQIVLQFDSKLVENFAYFQVVRVDFQRALIVDARQPIQDNCVQPLQQIVDVRPVEYAFACILHVRIDSLLYQIGQRVAGQAVQQIHDVQILVGFVESAH